MNSLLEQLGNEAVLMMYLAGELPEEDATEVRQLLESDRGLSQQLEALREAQSEFLFHMAMLDGVERPPLTEDAAARQASRVMMQWRVEQSMRSRPAEAPAGGLRYPWWVYPMATAAAVLIAFLVWWGNNPNMPGLNDTNGSSPTWAQAPSTGYPGVGQHYRPRGYGGDRLTRVMQQWRPLLSEDVHLAQAEEQLAALSDVSDASMLFPPEENW